MPLPPVLNGLQFWYDARDITGASDGSTISTWDDSSVNGRNATVASGSATYQTAQYAGGPALTLSGCHMRIGGSVIAATNHHTLFTIFKLSSTSPAGTTFPAFCLVGDDQPYSNAFGYWPVASAGKLHSVACNDWDTLATANSAADTNWHMTDVRYAPALETDGQSNFRLDAATDPGLFYKGGGFHINPPIGLGRNYWGNFFEGQVVVIGYYNRILSDVEILALEGYPYTLPPPASQVRGNIDWDQVGLDARHGQDFGVLIQYSDGTHSAGALAAFLSDGTLTNAGSSVGGISAGGGAITINGPATVLVNNDEISFDETALVNGV